MHQNKNEEKKRVYERDIYMKKEKNRNLKYFIMIQTRMMIQISKHSRITIITLITKYKF